MQMSGQVLQDCFHVSAYAVWNVSVFCTDHSQGVEYAEELETACRQIKNFVNNLETEMKERAALVEMLEQSQLYYDAQSSEANMVAMVSFW